MPLLIPNTTLSTNPRDNVPHTYSLITLVSCIILIIAAMLIWKWFWRVIVFHNLRFQFLASECGSLGVWINHQARGYRSIRTYVYLTRNDGEGMCCPALWIASRSASHNALHEIREENGYFPERNVDGNYKTQLKSRVICVTFQMYSSIQFMWVSFINMLNMVKRKNKKMMKDISINIFLLKCFIMNNFLTTQWI